MRKMSLVIASFVIVAAGLASAAVDVFPFRVVEQRSLAILPDKVSHGADALRVTLVLQGPEAQAATKYGELELEEAVDDKGTDLMPPKDQLKGAAKFHDYSNVFFRKSELESHRPVADPQIEIALAVPKRAATKIARLRGSVSIADQGTIKTIELADLKPGDKKKMDIPENAGVAITTAIKNDTEIRAIEVEIAGNDDVIASLEVVGASGNKISEDGGSWWMNSGPVHRTLNLNRPLDETMKLVAKVSVDRKITKVPFDLKDIDLP